MMSPWFLVAGGCGLLVWIGRKAARLQGLIQTAPDGLLIADSGGRLTFAQ